MESDAFALRTAIFVLVASVLVAASWLLLKDRQFEYQAYEVVSLRSIDGLASQSRVYYKGVEVGTIQEIYFKEKNFDRVHILIHVDESIPIARNTYAQLALRGVTGEYDLRLDNEGDLGAILPTSPESPGEIPMRPDLINQLTDAVDTALKDLAKISERIESLLSDENQRELTRMLSNVGTAAEQLSILEQRVGPTIDMLPNLVGEIEKTLLEYRQLATDFSQRTTGIDETLAQFNTAGASIEQLAITLQQQTLNNVDPTLQTISDTSRELTRVLQDLRQDPQRLLLGAPDMPFGPGELTRTQPL